VTPTEARAARPSRDSLSDRSLSELLSRLSHDTTELLSAQVELTKTEVREEVRQATRVGIIFGAASLLGFLALFLVSFAAAWGLSEIVPEGVAFLIVGVTFAVVAAIAFVVGRNAAKQIDPVPKQTMQTVKEDVQWARRQMS
jgi:predicted PurR-regulated permease PerM